MILSDRFCSQIQHLMIWLLDIHCKCKVHNSKGVLLFNFIVFPFGYFLVPFKVGWHVLFYQGLPLVRCYVLKSWSTEPCEKEVKWDFVGWSALLCHIFWQLLLLPFHSSLNYSYRKDSCASNKAVSGQGSLWTYNSVMMSLQTLFMYRWRSPGVV